MGDGNRGQARADGNRSCTSYNQCLWWQQRQTIQIWEFLVNRRKYFTRRLAESEQLFPDTPVQFVSVAATTRQEQPNPPCPPKFPPPLWPPPLKSCWLAEANAQRIKTERNDFLKGTKILSLLAYSRIRFFTSMMRFFFVLSAYTNMMLMESDFLEND